MTSAGLALVAASSVPACPTHACVRRGGEPAAVRRHTAGAASCGSCGIPSRSSSSFNRFCQPVRQLLVIIGRDGYARALCEGMKRDAVPGMSINGRQASV